MKPGYTIEQSYQDLIERAEAYFISLRHREDVNTPPGVTRWLGDLAHVRTREAVESMIPPEEGTDDILDVPL